ncbi:UbiA family prenyltransferase [Jannaschia sp. W003]|uniref:UbiA family prenyltransferase n=1 Tax=Jannaschia sp. W003 TaxID=2867012 RepID=UPI0021A28C1C|nr:UbiA family prenyltransferase [Jannaschia sp. W003]UWQ21549.1 UbiA family prenyltransferase [Jannaschia sp. W003]
MPDSVIELSDTAPPAADVPVYVVDLDGTLLRTDMLYETFWSALSRDWRNVWPIGRALLGGRARLKRVLQRLGPVNPATLPYDEEVLRSIERRRAEGARIVLASATDEAVLEPIAGHLGVFDAVHGSDGVRNLKGPAKARDLNARYGQGKYVYAGDSVADLAVWKDAASAVTVGVRPGLAARVAQVSGEVEALGDGRHPARAMLRAIRPHQWAKNALVFVPMLAAHRLDLATLGQATLAFVCYSLIASSVYLLNDLLDLDADRAHPRKRNRPFAAGTAPLLWGTVAAPALLLVGLGLATLLGPLFVAVMAGYFVATTAYSFWIKRVLVADVCTLAGLYTLRIIAGGVATGVTLSVWLLAFSMFFFFSLAAMKRQTELVASLHAGGKAAHGRRYATSDLPLVANMAVSSGLVSVLVMALYLNTETVQVLYATAAPLWGICLVLLFWINRMVMIAHRGWMDDDPVVFAARDRVSLVCAALIAAFAVAGTVL